MPARVSERLKELRGTQHKRPPPIPTGTPRLMRPIPPPRDLSPELRPHWSRHMAALVASGRASGCDLLAFNELCRISHLTAVAYEAACATGPIVPGTDDQQKGSPAWRSYLACSAAYRAWLGRFGLDPRSRGAVTQLPGLPGKLHVVGGDDDE